MLYCIIAAAQVLWDYNKHTYTTTLTCANVELNIILGVILITITQHIRPNSGAGPQEVDRIREQARPEVPRRRGAPLPLTTTTTTTATTTTTTTTNDNNTNTNNDNTLLLLLVFSLSY